MVPTVHNIPTRSNTSFGSGAEGFDSSVLDRWREHLSNEEVEELESSAAQLHRQALSRCVNAPG